MIVLHHLHRGELIVIVALSRVLLPSALRNTWRLIPCIDVFYERIVSLAVASRHFNLPDGSAVSLDRDLSLLDLLEQVFLRDSARSVEKLVLKLLGVMSEERILRDFRTHEDLQHLCVFLLQDKVKGLHLIILASLLVHVVHVKFIVQELFEKLGLVSGDSSYHVSGVTSVAAVVVSLSRRVFVHVVPLHEDSLGIPFSKLEDSGHLRGFLHFGDNLLLLSSISMLFQLIRFRCLVFSFAAGFLRSLLALSSDLDGLLFFSR